MEAPTLIVVGSGLAGLLVARLAAETQPVILITKNTLFDSNTRWSQGGIAAVWGENDSVELHSRDTVVAGDGLCDPQAVDILSRNSRTAVQKLIDLGTQFDTGSDQQFLLGLEGAHSVHRILHAGGDATGAEIQRALVESVSQHPNIEIHEHSLATEILQGDAGVTGVRSYHFPKQTMSTVEGQQVVVCTGGAGQLFRYTSNPPGATGDGVILAYRAGAELIDLEFYQFHPTALSLPDTPNFLISEAVRGEGAILRNSEGIAFMEAVHPQKDLAPRDVVARAMAYEIASQGGEHVYLDATVIDEQRLRQRFPTIFTTCQEYGVDLRKEWIPVTPVAHYMMGGVATDLWGRTTIPGLYACGEVARTGVHGANRLASNSLLEATVFAMRVAQILEKDRLLDAKQWPNTVSSLHENQPQNLDNNNLTPPLELSETKFRQLMWQHVGLIRNEQSLQKMCSELSQSRLPNPFPESKAQFELETMQVLGKLIAESALARQESRGAHFREDFPTPLKNQGDSIRKSMENDSIYRTTLP